MVYESLQELKNAINDTIYANDAGLITAEIVQERLHDIIDTVNAFSSTFGIKAYLESANDLTALYVGNVQPILVSEKGAAGGVAELDGEGKVPVEQLPDGVDEVIEVANQASLPETGATGVIYITLDTNKIFRWTGTEYVSIVSVDGDLSECFEVINSGLPTVYVRCKVPLAGVKEVYSYAAGDPGSIIGFQDATFDAALDIDLTTGRDWACTITDDCTVNIINARNGDAGMIVLTVDGTGITITPGTSLSHKGGTEDISSDDGAVSTISYRVVGEGESQFIIYTVMVLAS